MDVCTREEMLTRGESGEYNGYHYEIYEVFGHHLVKDPSTPQVYLVRQGAHGQLRAHFHRVPQFQIFVEGDGSVGAKSVAPPVVHYVDGWSTYGPITAGNEGIGYFTARVSADLGANYMPESKDIKEFKSGRHFTVSLDQPRLDAPSCVELIPRHPDGLGAYEVTAPAGARVRLPDQPADSERLVAVLDGGTSHPSDLGVGSWVAFDAGEHSSADDWTAADSGVRLVVLDYPAPSPDGEQAGGQPHDD